MFALKQSDSLPEEVEDRLIREREKAGRPLKATEIKEIVGSADLETASVSSSVIR